jgi:purine-binding chemotaxis protein CheW
MKTARIDWVQVRSRLRANEEALEEALRASPQRVQTIYQQRAVKLANLQISSAPASPGWPVMIFRLSQERYAIELKYLAEALPAVRCTPVPGSRPELLGVINVRGELRGVLSLSRLLALPESEHVQPGLILMLRRPDGAVGLLVDSIEELREIRAAELTPPMQARYLKGLASGTLPLLDPEALLTDVFSKEEL